TMSQADILYGVTMQEKGVSKLVSVKFAERHKATKPLIAPARIPKIEDLEEDVLKEKSGTKKGKESVSKDPQSPAGDASQPSESTASEQQTASPQDSPAQ
ncbi:MAG: hypothetical protein PHV55_08350, partial [Candidatus Omnitrophica bacterium]|nr:hypothetical protein [Candidatus Omnitrophota bacterium]